MSADRPADEMENLSGTPPETGLVPPQELPLDPLSRSPASIQPETNLDPQPTVEAGSGYNHDPLDDAHKIRGVGLLPGETANFVFSAVDGLITEPPATGQVLIVTNERLIAFCQADGKQETFLVPMDEVKHVVVKTGSRSASMLLQGSMMVVAGIFIYLVLGYWLTNQIEGPTIPVLHMDVAPFIALIIVLAGVAMIVQVYFTKPDGTVTIQGDGLQFTFPFRGEAAQQQIFDVVNTTFATRQTKIGEVQQLETSGEPPSGGAPSP